MAYQKTGSSLNNIVVYDGLGNTILPNTLRVLGLQTAGFVKTDANGLFYIDSTGSGFQPLNANLTALSGLTYTAPGGFIKMTGTNTFVLENINSTASTLQAVTDNGNDTNNPIILRSPDGSKQFELKVLNNGNILFTGGTGFGLHCTGDIVAFSDGTGFGTGTGSGFGSGHTIARLLVPYAQREVLSFGSIFTVTDDAANNATLVDFNAGALSIPTSQLTGLTLQAVTDGGNITNDPIVLTNTAGTSQVSITVDSNGNVILTAGLNKNFHFSGDVVAFSSLTPPASSWWDSLPIATATTLGGIKVGTGLTIDGSGVLSVGGGTVGQTTNLLTFNNSGSGASSGATFNGSTAVTVSYNTIGAAAASHMHAISDVTGLQTALDDKLNGTSTSGNIAYWSGTKTLTGETGFYWNTSTKRFGIKNAAGNKEVTIEVDSNGNIIFTAGLNQNFHFSGDVVAFSSLTPPVASWWDSLPIATASTLGGIKVGTGLSINGSGVLSVTTGSGVGSVTSISTSAPLTGGTITSTGTIGITQATTSTDGYLSSTDWNSFNNKQAGHIIWNNAGTSVTQETVLQFKRLDVTAETGKTVVTRPSDTYVSVSPPTSPFSGDTWISSETLKAYVYYDGFWVEDGSVAINGVTQAYVDAKFATRYARRSDFTGTYAYCGTAAFGSAEGSAVWYITRIPINANGTTGTVQRAPTNSIWTNRASLTYT